MTKGLPRRDCPTLVSLTTRKFSPEEKIRIVLEGLRGEQSVSDLCRE
jgi:transposase-like protein